MGNKVKVFITTLLPKVIDYLVAEAMGLERIRGQGPQFRYWDDLDDGGRSGTWCPTKDIEQAWIIIIREGITVGPHDTSPYIAHYGPAHGLSVKSWQDRYVHDNPLMAVMFAYLCKQHGRWVWIDKAIFQELCL